MSSSVAPLGWPRTVRPPGAPAWEDSAEAWLLDQCPPDYRGYAVLRRHRVVLARFAVLHVEGAQAGVRVALSQARGALRRTVPPDVAEEAVQAWLTEDARLAGVRREVGLVEEALLGRRFRPRL